jgi:hypothetical protein
VQPRIYTNKFDLRAWRPRFCSDADAIDPVTQLVFPLKALWLLFWASSRSILHGLYFVPIKFCDPALALFAGIVSGTLHSFALEIQAFGQPSFGRYFAVLLADYTL